MAKCPTSDCPEILATHSRRRYCAKCRAMMSYYAKKRPAELLDLKRRRIKAVFRMDHFTERRVDQQPAVTQLRAKYRAMRSQGS